MEPDNSADTIATPAPEPSAPLPSGDYAILEVFGHTTLIGRVAEVERFGSKMLQIEPLFAGQLLPPVLHGGASIYRLTPCTAEVALARAPKDHWQLPPSLRAVLPPALLDRARAAAPDFELTPDDEGED